MDLHHWLCKNAMNYRQRLIHQSKLSMGRLDLHWFFALKSLALVELKAQVTTAPFPWRWVLTKEKPSADLIEFLPGFAFSGIGVAAIEKNTTIVIAKIVSFFISTIFITIKLCNEP